VSGIRINMCKSNIMGLHVDGESVNSAARQLGCLVLNIPFLYLGSIVGDNMASQQAWREIVDRVKSKLSNWKMKMLSIGGRLTLVKYVLGSLPIYNFSIFKVPMCVLNELEGIRRKFFKGHEQDSKRTSWVIWNRVLMSKDRGGLGVSSLYAINRGLLVKWYLQIKLGDGESTKFWSDSWCKEGVLKEKFPSVFALVLCKNMNVADKVRQLNPVQTFRRIPRGETTGHSFFSYNMVRDINYFIARWWNINIVDFDCYDDWSTRIDSIRLSIKAKKTVEAVFYISWWLLWWSKAWSVYGTLELGKVVTGKIAEAVDVIEGDGGTGTIVKAKLKPGCPVNIFA
nr:RNA-directed DNA polymerase, eukaryota [Tanacetum cinerariifolium]